MSQLTNPARNFTFIDASHRTISDGMFVVRYRGWTDDGKWVDSPTDRHGTGANLAFADGHAEHWRWRWVKANQGWNVSAVNARDLADLRRMQEMLP